MAVGSTMVRAATQREGSTADRDRKLLFVLCGYGGASIVDSFLPLSRSEVDDDALADSLNVYEDSEIVVPEGSNLRSPAYLESAGLLAGIYQAKYYASEMAVRASGLALQLLGAAGYMKDHMTELYYRDARQLTIVEGTSQVQLGLIGRGVLNKDLWWD